MLNEDKRKQLDGIVSQMLSNKESDSNIHFVVNDFKAKYGNENPIPGTQSMQQNMSTGQKIGQGIKQGLTQAGQTAIGVGKGIANTLDSTSKLGQKAMNSLIPQKFKPQVSQLPTNMTTPTQAQKPGFVGEQLGEFIIPGNAASKVGKVAETAAGVGKLAKTAKVAATVGADAALTGAQTAMQGGSGKDVKNATIAGGATRLAGQGINDILKALPENAWRNILKRTSKQVMKNPDLPAQAAKTGLVGTREGIKDKAIRNIQHLELTLDDLLKTKTGTVDGNKVGTYLDTLKKTYKNVPGEGYAVNVIGTLQQEIRDKGKLSLVEANKLKRDIYGLVEQSYGKGTFEIPAKTESQKIIASGLRQEIEKVAPEVKDVNQKLGVYVQVKKAIERQLAQGEGRGIAGVKLGGYDLLTGGLGTIAGTAAGNPMAGIALLGAKKAIESPVTQSAVAKYTSYFNELSPTKKALFYNALRNLTVKGVSDSSD